MGNAATTGVGAQGQTPTGNHVNNGGSAVNGSSTGSANATDTARRGNSGTKQNHRSGSH
jgi:hypothetical protein